MKNKQNKKLNKIKYIEILLGFIFLLGMSSNVFASEITANNIESEINRERSNHGLSQLNLNSELNQAATLKSKDMINRNYFEHYAFGLKPWDFISISGYNYLYAGENLAMDFSTTEGMVSAWMNSPAHRDNILNPNYRDIGIGIVAGSYTENGKTQNTVMVSNMFGREKPTIVKIFDYVAKNVFNSLFPF